MKKETICIETSHDKSNGLVPPIMPSTAYHYVDEGPQRYPRYFNAPNQEAVAAKIAKLEHAQAGIIFGSGMAAISTSLMSFLKSGDHVVFIRGIYGGTHSFIVQEFEKWGIAYTFADSSVDSLIDAVNAQTKIIYIESPTNPLLTLVDLESLAKRAKEKGVLTMIDNTFASPINQNPIKLGIDLALHSGTKYLGGHSDLSCGAAVGAEDKIDQIREQAKKYGGTLNSLTCYLLDRSLKTLAVRVQCQCMNASSIAQALEENASVTRVIYPGLESHPQHDLAVKQMSGFGAMISFELGSDAQVRQFLNNLKVATPALSLGGVETTCCVPAITSHRALSPEELKDAGLSTGTIRLSVGIEHVDDLIEDLTQAIG